VACGSLLLGRFVDRLKDKTKVYVNLQILLSLLLFPTLLGVKAIRAFWNIHPAELIGLFPFLISVFVLLSPVCLIFGFQFALACRLYAQKDDRLDIKRTHKAVGEVYLFDALGDMLGGIIFAYLFVNVFYSFKTLTALIILNLSSAIILGLLFLKRKTRIIFPFFLLLVFASVVNSPYIHRLNNYASRLEWKGLQLQATDFSRYADYAVIKEEESFVIFGNGQLLFTVPDKALSEELIHLPLAEIENPRRILLLGGGIGGAIAQALKYPTLKEVVYLEKDPKLIRLARNYINPEDKKALVSSRTRIVIGDGRLYVKTYMEDKFDALILNVGNPLTAQLNRFYTLEFFKEAKRILKPGGVFFLGIDSHENYLSPEMRKFNGCIFRTLKTVFPHIVYFPGSTLYMAASQQGDFLSDDPRILSRRLEEQKVSSQYINEFTLPDRLNPERLSYLRGIFSSEERETERINRDFHPISYYYNLILWGSKALPQRTARVFWQLSQIKFGWLSLGLVFVSLILVLSRRRLGKNLIPLAVFIGGFAGISLELILIVGFQIVYGNLYFMIGIIIASFMLGLVLGTGLITWRLGKIKKKYLALCRIELGLGIYALVIATILLAMNIWRVVPQFFGIQILFPLLTVFSGFWVGMIFPLANSLYLEEEKVVGRTAGKLYGFDLLGACLGSMATTVFLVPLFGLIQTTLLISLICGIGVISLKAIPYK